jgi:hypothetical protein
MQVTLARSVDDYVDIALLALSKRGAVARRWRRELVLRRHHSPLFDRCVAVGVVGVGVGVAVAVGQSGASDLRAFVRACYASQLPSRCTPCLPHT